MNELAIRREMTGDIEEVVKQVTEKIKAAGFGVLTRIDFDHKIKEKLDRNIPKTVVLGACNPKLAFEAYQQTTDTALMIPCNIVVREIGAGKVAVEAIRPTAMLKFLPQIKMEDSVLQVEKNLTMALDSL